MAEAGIDIRTHTSDHVSRYAGEPFELVVTVCDNAKEACPTFPHARRRIHHAFNDPDQPGLSAEAQDALFRRVRDEIRDWASELIKVL